MAAVKDRQDQAITLHYHAGLLVLMTDMSGHQVVFHYQADRRIERVSLYRDGVARTLARYVYDVNGDLVRAYDEHEDFRDYQYNHHLITRYTDRTGKWLAL